MSILSSIFEIDELFKSEYSSFPQLESKLLELNKCVSDLDISQLDAMNEVILSKHLSSKYTNTNEGVMVSNASWNQQSYIQARNAVMDYCYKNGLYSLLPFTQLYIRGLKKVLENRVERFLNLPHHKDMFQEDIRIDVLSILSKSSASEIVNESKNLHRFSRHVSCDVNIDASSAWIDFKLATPYMYWHQTSDLLSFFGDYIYAPKSIHLNK